MIVSLKYPRASAWQTVHKTSNIKRCIKIIWSHFKNLNIYNISLNRCKYANKTGSKRKVFVVEKKLKLKKTKKWNFIQNVILLSKNITVQLTRSINVRWIFNWNFSFKHYYNNLIFDSHLIKVNKKSTKYQYL